MAKQHNTHRAYHLICTRCNTLWKNCLCPYSDENKLRITLTEEELQEYFRSGMVPDIQAELWYNEGAPKPPLIPAGSTTQKHVYLEVLRNIITVPPKKRERKR
jgi:hypothetical protein